ncbi:hypothetical protein C8Q74DRAFT_1247399 [Fomes fomentarius]|nr:hypothetical protein C8Q74DRAFT_1247399 [Fomes fomentarius]
MAAMLVSIYVLTVRTCLRLPDHHSRTCPAMRQNSFHPYSPTVTQNTEQPSRARDVVQMTMPDNSTTETRPLNADVAIQRAEHDAHIRLPALDLQSQMQNSPYSLVSHATVHTTHTSYPGVNTHMPPNNMYHPSGHLTTPYHQSGTPTSSRHYRSAPDIYWPPDLAARSAQDAPLQPVIPAPTLPRVVVSSVSAPIASSSFATASSNSLPSDTARPPLRRTRSSHSARGSGPSSQSAPSRGARERVSCPLCRSTFGRQQELDRHMRSTHNSDGALWVCCGVPLDQARSTYRLSEDTIATAERRWYAGIAMVGGCWEPTARFNRRDSYQRHMTQFGCIGDEYGEWHPGNR